jgi:hypothetical protein
MPTEGNIKNKIENDLEPFLDDFIEKLMKRYSDVYGDEFDEFVKDIYFDVKAENGYADDVAGAGGVNYTCLILNLGNYPTLKLNPVIDSNGQISTTMMSLFVDDDDSDYSLQSQSEYELGDNYGGRLRIVQIIYEEMLALKQGKRNLLSILIDGLRASYNDVLKLNDVFYDNPNFV